MSWVILAVFMALCNASMRIVNQHYKVSGFHLAILTKTSLCILTLPLAVVGPWPSNIEFYWFVLATVPLMIYADRMMFDLCSEYGGGPVSRIEPLGVVITFVIWILLNITLLESYAAQPLRSVIIILSLCGSVFFAMQMRSDPVSLNVLKLSLPMIGIYAFGDYLNKSAMDLSIDENGVVIYIFLQSLLMSTVGLSFMFYKKNNTRMKILNAHFAKAVVLCSVFMLAALIFKNNAFANVENPAYVTAINLSVPLWILIYNTITQTKDEIKILPGCGIVICACALIFATHI